MKVRKVDRDELLLDVGEALETVYPAGAPYASLLEQAIAVIDVLKARGYVIRMRVEPGA